MGEGPDPWELPFLSKGVGQGPEGKALPRAAILTGSKHIRALGAQAPPAEGIAYHKRTVRHQDLALNETFTNTSKPLHGTQTLLVTLA